MFLAADFSLSLSWGSTDFESHFLGHNDLRFIPFEFAKTGAGRRGRPAGPNALTDFTTVQHGRALRIARSSMLHTVLSLHTSHKSHGACSFPGSRIA